MRRHLSCFQAVLHSKSQQLPALVRVNEAGQRFQELVSVIYGMPLSALNKIPLPELSELPYQASSTEALDLRLLNCRREILRGAFVFLDIFEIFRTASCCIIKIALVCTDMRSWIMADTSEFFVDRGPFKPPSDLIPL